MTEGTSPTGGQAGSIGRAAPRGTPEACGGLRERLVTLVVLVLLLPLAVTSWLLEQHARERIGTAEASLSTAARHLAQDQAGLITSAGTLLATLANLPADRREGPACAVGFAAIAAGTPWALSVGTAGRDGVVRCASAPALVGTTIGDRPWFAQMLAERRFTVSGLLISHDGGGTPTLIAARPILGPEGDVASVLFVTLRLDRLASLAERAREAAGADLVILLDRQGRLVGRQPAGPDVLGRDLRDHPLIGQMLAQREGVLRGEGLDGTRRLLAFASVPEAGLLVSIARDEAALLVPVRREAAWAYGALLASAVAAAGLAWWFGRAVLLRGVEAIAAAARHGGSLAAVPLDRWAAAEVHDLHRALVSREAESAASERRWRSLGEAGAQVVWRATADGMPEALGWEALTGQSEEAMREGRWIEMIHPEERDGLVAAWRAGLAGGRHFVQECRIAAAGRGAEAGSGTAWRWMRIKAVPVRDAAGRCTEWVGTLQDIDAQRQAEAELAEEQARLRSVLDTAVDVIVVVDDRGIIRAVNPAAERRFGWSREDLVGQSAGRLMPPEMAAMHDRQVAVHARGERQGVLGMRRELEGVRRDGSRFPLEIVVTRWRDGAGRHWYTGIMRDVTERREAARALARSEARFRLLAENSGDVVVLCSADGTRRYVSPAAQQVLGWPPKALVGQRGQDLVHPDDLAILTDAILVAAKGAGESTATYRHRRPDGSWVWVDGHARRYDGAEEHEPGSYVVVLRDATERKIAEAALREALVRTERLATTDGLTGLANRRRFDDALAEELRGAARSGQPLSVMLVDADRFKLYNDRYGHLAGDDCLRAVAAVLGEVVRRPGDLAARYGGEEFVLLLPRTDAAGAWHVAERVRRALEARAIPHEDNPPGGVVTASIGLATWRPDRLGAAPGRAADLLAAADAALYQAKASGRNRVVTAGRLGQIDAGPQGDTGLPPGRAPAEILHG